MADVKVESFDVDVGANGSTHTLTNDVGDINSAFVRLNNGVRHMSCGPTGSTGNAAPNVGGVGVDLTATDTLTFLRDSSTTVKTIGEVWRYTGSSGGAYEFTVRGRVAITVTGTSASSAISGIANEDNCVPFISGIRCNDSSVSNFEAACSYAYMDGSGNVVVGRNNSSATMIVYVTVVEFTGSAWSVGHGVSSSHDTVDETVTLNTDSTGAGGSTFDVSDWETAFIEGNLGGDSAETGLADTLGVWYPQAATTQVQFALHEGDNNARNDSEAYCHVIKCTDLIVKRTSSTNFTETNGTYGTVGFPSGTDTGRNLEDLALEVYFNTSGTGTAHMRGSIGMRVTDETGTLQHWVHRSGNTVDARYGVIDLSQLVDSGTTEQLSGTVNGVSTVSGDLSIFTPPVQLSGTIDIKQKQSYTNGRQAGEVGQKTWNWDDVTIDGVFNGNQYFDQFTLDSSVSDRVDNASPNLLEFYVDPSGASGEFRAEIRTNPWDIQHALGTEEWIGFQYIFPSSYVPDLASNWLLVQNKDAAVGNSPAFSLWLSNDDGGRNAGELYAVNNLDTTVYNATGITPKANQELDIVCNVLYHETSGRIKWWVNGALVYDYTGRTVYASDPWGGNWKLGIYAFDWEEPAHVAASALLGINDRRAYIGPLRIITKAVGDATIGDDEYDKVVPGSALLLDGSTSKLIDDQSDDAAEEVDGSGSSGIFGSELPLSWTGFWRTEVGLRLPDTDIPKGSVVSNARIQFTAFATDSGTVPLLIYGIKEIDVAQFDGTAFEVSSLTKTSAVVEWSPPAWTADDRTSDQLTPDLSPIIQEIIDQSGYTNTQSIGIVITTAASETNKRSAYAYKSGTASDAPEFTTDFDGSGIGEVNVSGSLTYKEATKQLSGTVDGSSTVSGDIATGATTLQLSGTVIGSSTVSGQLGYAQSTEQLSGAFDGVSTVSGDLGFATGTEQLTGTVNGSSSVQGDIDFVASTKQLNGTIDGITTVTGNLGFASVNEQLTGSIDGVSDVSGQLGYATTTKQLSGVVDGLSDVSGDISYSAQTKQLSGVINGNSVVTGDISYATSIKQLTAQVDGVSAVSGDLTLQSVGLSGTIDSSSTVSGNLDIQQSTKQLSGTVLGESIVTGHLGLSSTTRELSGIISGSSSVIGNLTIGTSTKRLSGTINGVSVVVGSLTAVVQAPNEIVNLITPIYRQANLMTALVGEEIALECAITNEINLCAELVDEQVDLTSKINSVTLLKTTLYE